MRHSVMTLAAAFLLTATAHSATLTDSSAVAQLEHNSLWGEVLAAYRANPALMGEAFTTAYSEISAYYEHSAADKAVVMQEGKGHGMWNFNVNSYLNLGKKNKVWGGASYRTGMRRGILWNSTADYALLYPYVMADTLGGDLHSERYTFTGGCVTRIGRWTIGEVIDFRAEHEYRTYDPRPRSIVTDLSLSAGAACRAAGYIFGITAGGIFYKQTNSVSFFREEGVVPEYQMTGLGSDYKRFSGSNTSAYYKSTGYRIGLNLMPDKRSGAYLSATVSDATYKRILTTLNDLPISTLYLTRLRTETGWKHQGQLGWSAFAAFDYDKRMGNEIVAGSSVATEYKEIGELTMFKDRLSDVSAGAAVAFGRSFRYTITARGGSQKYAADYVFPARSMSFTKVYGMFDAQMQGKAGRRLALDCRLQARYYADKKHDMTMPLALMEQMETRLVNEIYDASKADYYTVGGSVRADYRPAWLKGYGLFVSVSYRYMHSDAGNKGNSVLAAVGMTF